MTGRQRLRVIFLLVVFGALCTGCAGTYRVGVEFLPVLRDHFIEYPTIEVDIAAVTEKEADEVRQMGVEKYFAPNSGIRERLHSKTFFFFRDGQHTFTLHSKDPAWKNWLKKKPEYIMVIASLPFDPSMSSQDDSRYMTIKMNKGRWRIRGRSQTVNIQVEPGKITPLSQRGNN